MQNRKMKKRSKNTKYLTRALTKISEKKERLETEKLSESFFPLGSTSASSENSINFNKSQQLRKPQIPKSSNPIKNQSTKNEEASLPIPPPEKLKKHKFFLLITVANVV